MKPFKEIFEDAMTTGDANLSNGTVVTDDDMRVPSGNEQPPASRVNADVGAEV